MSEGSMACLKRLPSQRGLNSGLKDISSVKTMHRRCNNSNWFLLKNGGEPAHYSENQQIKGKNPAFSCLYFILYLRVTKWFT